MIAAALCGTAFMVTALLTGTSASANMPVTKAATKHVECGTASNGLDVVAVTAHGKKACPLAVGVANKYLKNPHAGRPGPVKITVRGKAWSCRERIGHPDPYGECVYQPDHKEKVQLLS
jgi:hypothetical protein